MKRRSFLKGAALITAAVSLPVVARERIYTFAELFGPSPFPNPIYHTLAGPLVDGIIKPLETAKRFTERCAGTHFGWDDRSCPVEKKAVYTQDEVDQICENTLAYLDGYGFISIYGVGYAIWFNDNHRDPNKMHLCHHGSWAGRRWQYGPE